MTVDLVKYAVMASPGELLTESQTSQSTKSGDKVIFEKIVPEHRDYKLIKQMFRLQGAKLLSVYKKHDPQTLLLQNALEELSIGWIGCVNEMQKISKAFEELQTEGLKVTKSLSEVIQWVIVDQNLLSGDPLEYHKKKAQWRVVICLISQQFDQGTGQSKFRLVHPCYIADFSFKPSKIPQ